MKSKRSHEGYLLIDHRAGDGFGPRGSLTGPGSLFEAAIVTCSHCQRGVVINPDRTRAREYCPKCDHYICDECGLARKLNGGECRPFKQLADETLEAAIRASPQGA